MRTLPLLFLLFLLFLPLLCGNTVASYADGEAIVRQGKDYALFFAVDDYSQNDTFGNLPGPIVSAEKLAKELREMFGFHAEIVRNPSKDQIYQKLQEYRRRSFGANDQLLVFFSGHGDFDDFEVKGYFVPRSGPRIDLTTLGNIVTKIPCKHTLLAIDACYSGTIDNKIAFKGRFNRPGVTADSKRENIIARKLRNSSRLLLTSGEKRRTPSRTGGSPFALGFLNTLRAGYSSGDGLVTYEDLLARLERVSPLPHHGKLTGHEEGSFVFVSTSIVRPSPGPPPSPPLPPDNMVFIPGGTFQMGDQFGDGGSDEKPVHAVTVSDFYLSRTELTFAEYDRFCEATGIDLPDDEGWGRGNRPVINVSWFDAVAYCNWWSVQSGYTPSYQVNGTVVEWNSGANGYRLPTEAEWEYAARSRGQRQRFGNGEDVIRPTQANFDASSNSDYKETYSEIGIYRNQTVVVGSFSLNGLGLADMNGNVYEWCWDWKVRDGYYGQSPKSNPKGPAQGSRRVIRGGGWMSIPAFCRATHRSSNGPGYRRSDVGFRLARGS